MYRVMAECRTLGHSGPATHGRVERAWHCSLIQTHPASSGFRTHTGPGINCRVSRRIRGLLRSQPPATSHCSGKESLKGALPPSAVVEAGPRMGRTSAAGYSEADICQPVLYPLGPASSLEEAKGAKVSPLLSKFLHKRRHHQNSAVVF